MKHDSCWNVGSRDSGASDGPFLARSEDGGVGAGPQNLPRSSSPYGPAAVGRFWRPGTSSCGNAPLAGLDCSHCVTFACCRQSTNQPKLKQGKTQGSSWRSACLTGVASKQLQPTAKAGLRQQLCADTAVQTHSVDYGLHALQHGHKGIVTCDT